MTAERQELVLVGRNSLPRESRVRRTRVAERPGRERLLDADDARVIDPSPALDRAERLVVHDLEALYPPEAVKVAVGHAARPEGLGPEATEHARLSSTLTLAATGLERMQRVIDVQRSRQIGNRHRRRLEGGVRPGEERLVRRGREEEGVDVGRRGVRGG